MLVIKWHSFRFWVCRWPVPQQTDPAVLRKATEKGVAVFQAWVLEDTTVPPGGDNLKVTAAIPRNWRGIMFQYRFSELHLAPLSDSVKPLGSGGDWNRLVRRDP